MRFYCSPRIEGTTFDVWGVCGGGGGGFFFEGLTFDVWGGGGGGVLF